MDKSKNLKITDMELGVFQDVLLPFQSSHNEKIGIPPEWIPCSVVRLSDGWYHRIKYGGDSGRNTLYYHDYEQDTEIEYRDAN